MKYFYLLLVILTTTLLAIDIAVGNDLLVRISALCGWTTALILQIRLDDDE